MLNLILMLNTMLIQYNEKDAKFKVCDHVRISKYKIIFAKGYTPNWSEVFVISKIKKNSSMDSYYQ